MLPAGSFNKILFTINLKGGVIREGSPTISPPLYMNIQYQSSVCVLAVVALLCLGGCRKKPGELFSFVPGNQTSITFNNTVTETGNFNILSYEYMYNGGGVAAGDFNNDGLQDLFFTGNQVDNALYLNQGDFTFKDIARNAGVAGKRGWRTGVTTVDINNDGFLDIYVSYSGPGDTSSRANELFINGGGSLPRFAEKARDYGLDATGTYSTQAAFFDFDLDGDLDMFLLNHAKITYNPFYNSKKLRATRHRQYGNRLYRNDGGHYLDVSVNAGIFGSGINFGLGVSISDLNNDGWPDIYVTNDYEEQDYCYLNSGNGTFKDVLKQSFRHISRFAMGVDVADFNNDGMTDVFVADMLPEDGYRQKVLKGSDEFDKYYMLRDSGYHHQNMRNMLQVNLGGSDENIPRFAEIAQLAGVSNTDWSWSPLFVDLDNDGWKDLFITNGYLRDYTNMDFLKYAFQDHRTRLTSNGKPLDTMEIVRLMPATKLRNYCFRNGGNFQFENFTETWGIDDSDVSTGATFVDLDNDGDQDIVVNRINDQSAIYRNNSDKMSTNHWLKINLKGAHPNAFAVGAKVTVKCGTEFQYQEFYPTRGFQSAVSNQLIFGIGKHTRIDEVTVQWPDQTFSRYENVKANTLLHASIQDTISDIADRKVNADKAGRIFDEVDPNNFLDFTHNNNNYVDFKTEFLLPYQLSSSGPCLAKGDLNRDGFDDLFVGGSVHQQARLFLSTGFGYELSNNNPWNQDLIREHTDALFFDADGDEDLDLYIVQGGNEVFDSKPLDLNDQLYLNDGDGHFLVSASSLPKENANGFFVTACDYDKDGDIDLFIGGHALPGYYPLPSNSRMLRNDSNRSAVEFTDITPEPLKRIGLLTSGVWTDVNNDKFEDLVVTGEFCPVYIIKNTGGVLNADTASYIPDSHGLWRKIIATDIDNDGDDDLIGGNVGINNQFKASAAQPIKIHFHDFNEDGKIDPIFSYFINGKPYIYPSRDELLEQLPHLKQKFVKYADYATARLSDILTPQQFKKARVLRASSTSSTLFLSAGDGLFQTLPLPIDAQFSHVNCIISEDFNGDGSSEILISGNFYPQRVQFGRNDASSGLFMKWENREFKTIRWGDSGFYADGDVRSMVTLRSHLGNMVVCGVNNNRVKLFKSTESDAAK